MKQHQLVSRFSERVGESKEMAETGAWEGINVLKEVAGGKKPTLAVTEAMGRVMEKGNEIKSRRS